MAAPDFFAHFGFAEVALEGFPNALPRSAPYRALPRYGDEWGLVAMARTNAP